MGMQCPKCGSENVQAVRAILQAGTTYSNGSVTGITAGENAGVFTGIATGMSQTTLAARFSPPTKPSKFVAIGIGVIALASSPWLAASGPDAVWRYLNLAFWGTFALFLWSYLRKAVEYKGKYPKWKAMHDNGFYCHRCGTSYIA